MNTQAYERPLSIIKGDLIKDQDIRKTSKDNEGHRGIYREEGARFHFLHGEHYWEKDDKLTFLTASFIVSSHFFSRVQY